MFKRLLIAGTVFLATACVPIPPEPAGRCISNERALLIGETVKTEPSDELPGYIDIVKVESELNEQVLTVILHLRDIPEGLTFNREGMKDSQIEYSWTVLISESANVEPWADEVEKMARFKHQLMTAHFAESDEPNASTYGSIADIAESVVWVLKRDEDGKAAHAWYAQALWEAGMEVSHEDDTLTMTGFVPGFTGEALLVVETSDYLHGRDKIRCDSAEVLSRHRPVPEVEFEPARPPSAGAELKDLATILAKMDRSDSSDEYTTLLREFSDCFLSNLTARERKEGLGDDNGEFAITPAQITAVTLFQAGVFAVVGQYEETLAMKQSDSSPRSVNMYDLLEGALAVCEDSN